MSKVLIAGGTGLIGGRLSDLLAEKGYQVVHLSRKKRPDAPYKTYQWDTKKNYIEETALTDTDYVINLAGAGIAEGLWTTSRKKLIIESRVQTADLLGDYIAKMSDKPKAYLSSAAIGIYGDRGDEELTEESEIGTEGFMVKCCREWEYAITKVATQTGIRTVGIRIGIVLSTQGGALPKMMLPTKFFTASYFGDGRQWYSWIHIDDVCRMFIKAMEDKSMEGIYNGTSPHPLRHKALTKQMVDALDKNALVVPAPAPVLRLGMGEMADVVLNSNKVFPARMEMAGFEFHFPDFSEAIQDLKKRNL